ncbi:zf-CCHC domain-containing protein [Tanacetum coccineum]
MVRVSILFRLWKTCLERASWTSKEVGMFIFPLAEVRVSYADKRRKPLEFSVGDYVLLKVLPWKGVVRFRKKGKLAPRFVGPFEIVEKIQVDAKLNFVEESVEILEREFKKLKRSRISIVKVWWNSKRGPEFTWEREDHMKLKYPHLFCDFLSLSGCDTKYVNAISLVLVEDDKGKEGDEVIDKNVVEAIELVEKEKINKKTIEDLIDNHKYNDSLLATRLDRKDGREGNFVIACSIVRLKYMNALANQGFDVNIMPLSIYNKLTSENPIGTNIKLSLANHAYVYPLGIAEEVLIDVARFVYHLDFFILDIKEDDYLPLILETPFFAMARVKIKCDKGSMTIKSSKIKVRFIWTLRFPSKIKDRIRRYPDPMIPTNYVNRRILEWEERIENCQEDKIEFSKWRSKVFDDKNLVGHNFFIYNHELEKESSSVSEEGVTLGE